MLNIIFATEFSTASSEKISIKCYVPKGNQHKTIIPVIKNNFLIFFHSLFASSESLKIGLVSFYCSFSPSSF